MCGQWKCAQRLSAGQKHCVYANFKLVGLLLMVRMELLKGRTKLSTAFCFKHINKRLHTSHLLLEKE